MLPTILPSRRLRQATLALEWWAQYPSLIPFHVVVRGLRLSYTSMREAIRLGTVQVVPVPDEPDGCLTVAEAHRLFVQTYGVRAADLAQI